MAFKSYDAAIGAMDAQPSFGGALSPAPVLSPPAQPPRVEVAALTPVALPQAPRVQPAPADIKVGPAYEQNGKIYVPAHEPDYNETGLASWYGESFHGKVTANGEIFDQFALTAAHPTLPIPSMVRVTNLQNGAAVMLRVNDRGPFAGDRLIDVSRAAAEKLGFIGAGLAQVRVEWAGPAQAINTGGAKPAPIAKPQIAAPSSGTGFVVQAGAFSEVGNALRLKEQLAAFGPSEIQPAKVRGSDIFRVVVGPWSDRAAAEAANAQLRASGVAKGLVRSVS